MGRGPHAFTPSPRELPHTDHERSTLVSSRTRLSRQPPLVLIGDVTMEIIIFAVAFACVFLLGTVLPTLIFMREKRLVWPYADPAETHSVVDPDGYGARTVQIAIDHGFTFLGWASDAKGGTYKLAYGMILSADRRTIGTVGIGTLLGMRLKGTVLRTFAEDGSRACLTMDNPACSEPDALNLWSIRVLPNAVFPMLFAAHEAEVSEKLGPSVLSFPPGEELDAFAALLLDRCDRLAAAGLIHYTDPDRIRWQYTFRGATKLRGMKNKQSKS